MGLTFKHVIASLVFHFLILVILQIPTLWKTHAHTHTNIHIYIHTPFVRSSSTDLLHKLTFKHTSWNCSCLLYVAISMLLNMFHMWPSNIFIVLVHLAGVALAVEQIWSSLSVLSVVKLGNCFQKRGTCCFKTSVCGAKGFGRVGF